MSSIALEQHVKRRVRVKPLPRPADFRNFDKDSSGQLLLENLLGGGRRKIKWADTSPSGIVQQVKRRPSPVLKTKRAKKKEKPPKVKTSSVFRRSMGFLFGKGGLLPLPVPAVSSAGRSFPLFPIIAAVLTLIISVAALNWKFPALKLSTGSSLGGYFLTGQGELDRDLASYAGLYTQESGNSAGDDGEIPLDMTETFTWKEYRVKKGDTLSEIAKVQELSLGTLIACNSITNARRLREGEVLRIPNMDGIPYTVKAGDSLSGISASSGVPLAVILDVNDLESDVINPGAGLFLPGVRMPQEDIRLALGESFIYPLRGILSSSYGWRIDPISKVERFHSAIDLAAPLGTPVKAAMDGKVSRVAVNSVYGIYIIITHPGGYQSLYAHLSAALIKQGASVIQGSKIGEVGSTGYSTGPHLHFGVFKNNKAINPLEVLQR